jgi:hypothetical protein
VYGVKYIVENFSELDPDLHFSRWITSAYVRFVWGCRM